MTLKELKESVEKGNVLFGIKQALKSSKNLVEVFVAKDTRQETIQLLDSSKIEFSVLKSRAELQKELDLDFSCEVFSIVKSPKAKKFASSEKKGK